MAKPFTTPSFQRFEMFIMRVLLALVIWDIFPGAISFREQPAPSGLAHFLDLTFLSEPGALRLPRILLFLALALYCSGCLLWIALPVILILTAAVGSLANSQGAITHSTQLPVLVIFAQCVWYLYDALRNRLRKSPAPQDARLQANRTAAFIAQQAVVSAYVVTALSKIFTSGLVGWISDARYFPLQLVKTARMDYYNTLTLPDPPDGVLAPVLPFLQALFTSSTALTRLFLASGLFLELCAFLALIGRRWNFFYGALLIVFHLTVSAVMDLHFQYNIYLLAIFLLNIPYWISRPFSSQKA